MLAFTLFVTMSFHFSPYSTGSDIVFVFAWIPSVLLGSGGVLSLDGVAAPGALGSGATTTTRDRPLRAQRRRAQRRRARLLRRGVRLA